MTLVATLSSNGQHVMVGDLLVSRATTDSTSLKTPSKGTVSTAAGPVKARKPVDLVQKIVRVSDNLCLGWSDGKINAKVLIRDLAAEFGQRGPSGDEVQEFVRSHPEANNVHLVGLSVDAGRVRQFGFGEASLRTKSHGQVDIIGSGETDLRNILENYEKQFGGKALNDDPFGTAVTLAGALFVRDFETAVMEQAFYGGGFEIAYFDGRKLTKAQDVTYLFWGHSQERPPMTMADPVAVVTKFNYVNDVLVVRRIENVRLESDREKSGAEEEPILVPPLLGEFDADAIRKLQRADLNSGTMINCKFKRDADKVHMFAFRQREDDSIEFVYGDGQIRVRVPEWLNAAMSLW